MTKKTSSYPEFIQLMDWPAIIFLLFLVAFLGGLTCQHYFRRQQQLRWQAIQDLQTAEMAKLNQLNITEDLLKKADLNQDCRVDTKDYAILAHIISSAKTEDTQE